MDYGNLKDPACIALGSTALTAGCCSFTEVRRSEFTERDNEVYKKKVVASHSQDICIDVSCSSCLQNDGKLSAVLVHLSSLRTKLYNCGEVNKRTSV